MSYRNCDGIEFLRSLPAQSVDGIITDPPWGGRIKIQGQKEYLELVKAMDSECERILRPGARVLIWWTTMRMPGIFKAINYLDFRWMVFVKYIPSRYVGRFQSQFDPILFFQRPGDKLPMPEKSIPQEYLKPSKGRPDSGHPCARPIEVSRALLRDWFRPGEYIVDPFAGSDTTGFACREMLNPYDTCEIDPKMYVYGKRRHSQMLIFDNKEVFQ